ncbi:TetR/AcrR family transcriptional regulator [Nocardia huaxiensis]|uniref:TetR/AcrR family transcriptional regulator n=1 Tax=Nocardia huaxiensis TaxID=2755382 RepID=A0A7D6V4W9_9NOCA|nr:TetR/AcrR family transcriptional regulator [Nocardia huaxiensis]QLY27581.1 TetR/AcrR family transcriptional regulator [Nocardia huaxiensis]UFS99040.1 TetR/AcrR family transcriptional regulator [Nocardia huaxiensis]
MTERRERILDAARSLIVRDGYAGASMHAIARAAEVTRPALYAEFADRDELIEALIDREEERVLAMSAAATPELSLVADPARIAEQSVDVFLNLVQAAPETWRLVFMRGDGMPPATHARIERGRDSVRQQTHLLLGLLASRSERQIDTELLSHGVISVSETAARMLVSDPSMDRDRVSSTLRWLVRHSVARAGIAVAADTDEAGKD